MSSRASDSAKQSARRPHWALRAFFLVAFACATWGYWLRLDTYPPWMDFDSATLGIFVNNLSFQDRYDHQFNQSPVDQDRYRMYWAAEFLPVSVPLSRVQVALGIPPDRVGDYLKAVALVLAILGSAVAATVASRRGGLGAEDALFVFGLSSALPAFLLYLRTTVPHFFLSFLMFWAAVLWIDRYLETGSRRSLYALAATLALYAQAPYVPMLALPLIGVLLALRRHAAGRVLRDPHLYIAAVSAALLFAALQYAVAVTHEPTWTAWNEKASHFVASRSLRAASVANLSLEKLPDKLTKLVHQHFYYRRDTLGDQTRNDYLWTLPQPHLVWLALLPLALLGAWRSWRTRDATAEVLALVLLCSYALVLTVSFPEGRYLITVVPVYAYFVWAGLRQLLASDSARTVALAVVLIATAANSYLLVSGPYNELVAQRWRGMATMREALGLIRDRYGKSYGRDRIVHLSWPELRYEAWLYLEMLGNMRVSVFDANESPDAVAPGEVLFAAASRADAAAIEAWKAKGFEPVGDVVDPVSSREIELLAREPAPGSARSREDGALDLRTDEP